MPSPNATKVKVMDGTIDLDGDTLRVALYNDTISFTFNPDNHEFVDDVLDGTTAEEFGDSGGTGYSRQGVTGQIVNQDDANDRAEFDIDDVDWSGLDNETIQGIVVYRQVGGDDTTPADDEIITVVDDSDAADLPLATNGSAVALSINSVGLVTLT